MDGFPHDLSRSIPDARQRTVRTAIGCVGVGLHSGQRITLTLRPAAAGSGIVFRRTDLGIDIPARFDCVVDTRMCTVLAAPDAPQARVGTVEHVMAALAACRIDNAVVEVDGPEIPVLDGSSAPFVFLIDCAGVVEQSQASPSIEVLRTVRVEEGESFVELRPALGSGFDLAVSIEFAAHAIGRQALSLTLDPATFRQQLARARTFAMAEEIAGLQAVGLARGGSLDNAVVVDGARVLNPAGLRMTDEFVRHKMLDVVGDLALAGTRLVGRVVAHRPGHTLNNKVLRALFADASAWVWTDAPVMAGWASTPMPAAAAPV